MKGEKQLKDKTSRYKREMAAREERLKERRGYKREQVIRENRL